jgi:hypothetical protein
MSIIFMSSIIAPITSLPWIAHASSSLVACNSAEGNLPHSGGI